MGVSRINSFFIWTPENPLDLHSRYVGKHQRYGDQRAHGRGFKKRGGKFGEYKRNQYHERARSHIPQKECMIFCCRRDGINLII